MSRRQRNNAAGVSLFPFLDVLVCTMGSLILLLLVATSRIRAAAVDKARQAAIQEKLKAEEVSASASGPQPVAVSAEPEPEPEIDLTPEWRTRVEQLTADRDSLREQLKQSRSQLQAVQSTVMRTKVKAASTEDRLQEIRSQQEQSKSDQERLQREIESLQSDLTEAEQRLTKAVERQVTATSKFAFLPFDGRTGTTKRPILIECTQEYIRFLPEDVRLTPADLNGFTSGFNPILEASRELVHFWKAYDRVHEGENGPNIDSDSTSTGLIPLGEKTREPYVLLLVRPNGAVAFHIAKGFLSQLKVAHGYELITDDMELDTSAPDPDAKQICKAAVAQVLSEREKVLEVLARNRSGQRDQLELEPTARTFVTKEPSVASNGFSRNKTVPSAGGGLGSGQSEPLSDGRSTTASSGTRVEGGTSVANQQNAASSPRSAQQGRIFNSNEPPEEPLPQPNSRRYENDDSKPFPFGRNEKSAPVAQKPSTPNSRDPHASGARPSGDPRAANGSSGGNNMAKMKRRYQMPRAGIGLEKAIPIRIWANRVLVGGEYEIPVDAVVRTESLIDRILMGMDRVQSDWPRADDGYHWVPTIKYEVIPGGEQVHQRLTSALFELGLVSRVEFLDADPDAPVKAASSQEVSRTRAVKPASGGAK